MRGISVFFMNTYLRHHSEPVQLIWVEGVKWCYQWAGGKPWAQFTGKCWCLSSCPVICACPCHSCAGHHSHQRGIEYLSSLGGGKLEQWEESLEVCLWKKCWENAAWTASLLERQKECAFWVTFIATLKVTAFFSQLFWEVCLSYQLPACCCRT